jgi:hypothetical protein
VVAHVAQLNAAGGEARPGRFVTDPLVPVVTYVYEREFFEPHVRPVELLLGARGLRLL